MSKFFRNLIPLLTSVALISCEPTEKATLSHVRSNFTLETNPSAVAHDPHNVAIVLDSGEDAVSLVDLDTYRELSRFPIGKEPHHLMATPDDRYLMVANAVSNSLVLLDPHTGQIQKRIEGISDPYQIQFSPDRRWFVAVSLRLDRVDIYNYDPVTGFHLANRVPLGKAPSHLAFSQDSSTVFVTLQDSNELAAIDVPHQKPLWKVPIGPTPAGIWMTPGGKVLLIGIMGENYVHAFDWQSRHTVKKIVTANGAHNFLPAGDGKHVFVSNRVANSVCIVNESSLENEGCFPVPGGPDCMEVSRDGSELWVTSRFIKRVEVIDLRTRTIKRSIPVGRSPHGVYFFQHAART